MSFCCMSWHPKDVPLSDIGELCLQTTTVIGTLPKYARAILELVRAVLSAENTLAYCTAAQIVSTSVNNGANTYKRFLW